jgi:hypothetical protein
MLLEMISKKETWSEMSGKRRWSPPMEAPTPAFGRSAGTAAPKICCPDTPAFRNDLSG